MAQRRGMAATLLVTTIRNVLTVEIEPIERYRLGAVGCIVTYAASAVQLVLIRNSD